MPAGGSGASTLASLLATAGAGPTSAPVLLLEDPPSLRPQAAAIAAQASSASSRYRIRGHSTGLRREAKWREVSEDGRGDRFLGRPVISMSPTSKTESVLAEHGGLRRDAVMLD